MNGNNPIQSKTNVSETFKIYDIASNLFKLKKKHIEIMKFLLSISKNSNMYIISGQLMDMR